MVKQVNYPDSVLQYCTFLCWYKHNRKFKISEYWNRCFDGNKNVCLHNYIYYKMLHICYGGCFCMQCHWLYFQMKLEIKKEKVFSHSCMCTIVFSSVEHWWRINRIHHMHRCRIGKFHLRVRILHKTLKHHVWHKILIFSWNFPIQHWCIIKEYFYHIQGYKAYVINKMAPCQFR